MKFEDVDSIRLEMINYHTIKGQLKIIKGQAVQHVRFAGGVDIIDWHAIQSVKGALEPIIQKKFDECIARLMLFGITEFPE